MILEGSTAIDTMADSTTKSIPIESITLVPTAGESSPTSVVVDVTATCKEGVSELKRIQRYASQLFIPEEMIYGNDLIKVWNIEDERQVEDDAMDVTLIKEEATYDKFAVAAPPPVVTSPKLGVAEHHKKVKVVAPTIPHHLTHDDSTRTITLDSNSMFDFDEDLEEEEREPSLSEYRHRRGVMRKGRNTLHRRHHNHFEFNFQ